MIRAREEACDGAQRDPVPEGPEPFTEFQNRYGTDEQCEAAVRRGRWPDGFACPRCGGREQTVTGKRRLHECHACRLQTSLKAGTIFAKPLVKWFQAMFLVTQSKNSILSFELSR